MPSRVAMLCAMPALLNPGMLAVDLAFECLRRRHGWSLNLTRYCLRQPPAPLVFGARDEFALAYQRLLPHWEEVMASDVTVYWGDFLHAQHFRQHDLLAAAMRQTGMQPGTALQEFFNDRWLLSSAPLSHLHRTISFGTTLVGDTEQHLAQRPRYASALTRFVTNVRRIWMRDVYSATQVAHLRGDYQQNFLGVDCSLLLRPEDYAAIAGLRAFAPTRPEACIHFGRTPIDGKVLLAFARDLCDRLGVIPHWLPWLNRNADYIAAAQQVIPALRTDTAADFASLLAQLGSSTATITDTYHLALISWRLGIPAVCIGQGSYHPQKTVSDKKKEIFYYTYNASPLYVFAEALLDTERRSPLLKRIVAALRDRALTQRIADKIANHALQIEPQLAGALQETIAST